MLISIEEKKDKILLKPKREKNRGFLWFKRGKNRETCMGNTERDKTTYPRRNLLFIRRFIT